MTNTNFTKTHDSSSLRFWTWRELNRRVQHAKREDEDQAIAFAERAQEMRDQLEFLLSAGLSEGAEHSLNALAEEDMTDFCIMVDLAEPIDIPGVTPLAKQTRQHLHNFLDGEPWHSLVIDNDITVALASLDAIGATESNRPWYEQAPHLVELLARLLDQVNKEQLLRLVGEYNSLAARDNLHLPKELGAAFEALVHSATQRLGMPMQEIRS
jgi:nitroreductase